MYLAYKFQRDTFQNKRSRAIDEPKQPTQPTNLNSQNPPLKWAFKAALTPFQTKPRLRAFAKDLSPAADEIKKLLDDLDQGKDISAAAASLADWLPSLLPDDPALAAIIAEEMAAQFTHVSQGEVGEAGNVQPSKPSQLSQSSQQSQESTTKLANSENQPRGKTTEDSNAGSFAPAKGGTTESPLEKCKPATKEQVIEFLKIFQ